MLIDDAPVPPFMTEFLESSQRLSGPEIGLASAFVAEGESYIRDLDVVIARGAHSPTEKERMAQQRVTILRQVEQYKDSLRAVRRLPPEIISEFLALAVTEVPLDEFPDPPWYLSHVCGYWRDIAVGIPTLWSDIVIQDPTNFPLERLETQLSRSQNAPLKVLLWSSHSGDDRAATLLRMLVECAPRWISASIFIAPDKFSVLAGVRGRIPHLRYLRINVVDYGRRYRSTDETDPFEIAPELREVSFEDLYGLHNGSVN
ncbi:hypothetical protein FB451DRAFT_507276 [Mycena latifolia]|nr:hypothetical protein FB451DRAFT_507276 [Mycena latifolia]